MPAMLLFAGIMMLLGVRAKNNFSLFFYKKLSAMFHKQYNDVIKSVIPLRNIKP